MKKMTYQTISKKKLKEFFRIDNNGKSFILQTKRGINTININIPFTLNEECAAIAGMMPDGSLVRDLKRIYFTQKKDIKKIYQFQQLLKKVFSPSNKIFIRQGNNCFETYTNSQTMAIFFYKILEIPKSREVYRIPKWIFKSPKSVKIAYLKEAYDMEGTILKKLTEIRFITKYKEYALDLQKLLSSVEITSHVKPRIGGTHRTIQYRISVYRKENFLKFKQIGFRIPFLRERFQLLLKKYQILDRNV